MCIYDENSQLNSAKVRVIYFLTPQFCTYTSIKIIKCSYIYDKLINKKRMKKKHAELIEKNEKQKWCI